MIPKAITSTFLTFILKSDHPQNLDEYKPICLIGCLYKIVAKLLARRLKVVLDKSISKCQTNFIPKIHIFDGVVEVNEINDLAKIRKEQCLLLKVEFKKAYDCV